MEMNIVPKHGYNIHGLWSSKSIKYNVINLNERGRRL